MQYVAGLMFTADKSHVALVLKDRPKWQAGLFNAIGGKIENDEQPATAMAREFLEETGVETQPEDWEYFTTLDGAWGQVVFFRMFDDRAYQAKTIESEEIHLTNPLRLPLNIVGNIRWIVPLAMDTNTLAPRIIKHMG